MNGLVLIGGAMGLAGIILGMMLGADIVEALLGSTTTYWWAVGLTFGGALTAELGDD